MAYHGRKRPESKEKISWRRDADVADALANTVPIPPEVTIIHR